ncbi:MAG TPA: ABC transporter [Desulfotomaculum sp.]|nr:ABC transporter [Desulfotomaculum sp.]
MIFMLEAYIKKELWHFDLDLSLSIGSQIMVLWGPSGAGKTTILHCLAGLHKPSSGYIRLNGRTLYSSREKIDTPARLRRIGYLFQDYALFPHMSVRQNVLFGVKGNKSDFEDHFVDPVEMLNSFGVGHLIDRFPHQLSGGEKQRVALTRALAASPELLLLDEPFSALDKNTKTRLRKELKELQKRWRIPFVLVSHDEEDASFLGDSIITLPKGKS